MVTVKFSDSNNARMFHGAMDEQFPLLMIKASPSTLTGSDVTVTIPNGALSNGPVVDVTGNETRRLDVEIGISYDSDAEKALELLSQIASETPQVLPEPEIQTAITAYADSSVNLVLRVWVKTPDYWTAKFFINRRLRQLFSENNIEIPYPQMDVHIKNK